MHQVHGTGAGVFTTTKLTISAMRMSNSFNQIQTSKPVSVIPHEIYWKALRVDWSLTSLQKLAGADCCLLQFAICIKSLWCHLGSLLFQELDDRGHWIWWSKYDFVKIFPELRTIWGQQLAWPGPVAFSPAPQTMWTGLKRSVDLRNQICCKKKIRQSTRLVVVHMPLTNRASQLATFFVLTFLELTF